MNKKITTNANLNSNKAKGDNMNKEITFISTENYYIAVNSEYYGISCDEAYKKYEEGDNLPEPICEFDNEAFERDLEVFIKTAEQRLGDYYILSGSAGLWNRREPYPEYVLTLREWYRDLSEDIEKLEITIEEDRVVADGYHHDGCNHYELISIDKMDIKALHAFILTHSESIDFEYLLVEYMDFDRDEIDVFAEMLSKITDTEVHPYDEKTYIHIMNIIFEEAEFSKYEDSLRSFIIEIFRY